MYLMYLSSQFIDPNLYNCKSKKSLEMPHFTPFYKANLKKRIFTPFCRVNLHKANFSPHFAGSIFKCEMLLNETFQVIFQHFARCIGMIQQLFMIHKGELEGPTVIFQELLVVNNKIRKTRQKAKIGFREEDPTKKAKEQSLQLKT